MTYLAIANKLLTRSQIQVTRQMGIHLDHLVQSDPVQVFIGLMAHRLIHMLSNSRHSTALCVGVSRLLELHVDVMLESARWLGRRRRRRDGKRSARHLATQRTFVDYRELIGFGVLAVDVVEAVVTEVNVVLE